MRLGGEGDGVLGVQLSSDPEGFQIGDGAARRQVTEGGGGIEPDKYVAGQIEGLNPTPFGRALYSRQEFETYSQKFIAEGDSRITLPLGKGWVVLKKGFSVDDQMLKEFRDQLVANRIRIDESSWQKDLAFIRAMIRFRIDEAAFGIAEARRRMVEVDPQAQVALASFGEAEKLPGVQAVKN